MFNTIRTLDAPLSLLSRQRYDGEDVYTKLCEIFYNKCYICETKEPHDINVEHFDSHQGDLDKKFDWNNLYLACSRCNNIKGTIHNNILDCCDSTTDVFRAIKHLPPATPYGKAVQIICMIDNVSTLASCELLGKVYNSDHTVNKKVSGAFIRRKIFDQYNLLLDQIDQYYSPVATEPERSSAIERIKVLIHKSAPYSAFIRWCIIDDQELGELLEAYMD